MYTKGYTKGKATPRGAARYFAPGHTSNLQTSHVGSMYVGSGELADLVLEPLLVLALSSDIWLFSLYLFLPVFLVHLLFCPRRRKNAHSHVFVCF